MQLKRSNLKETSFWSAAEIELPKFNLEKMIEQTVQTPKWVHIGAGNIFRGFVARAHQDLLDNDQYEYGITVVESFDFEVIDKVYAPNDNLTLLVQMHADGAFDKKVVASIAESMTTEEKNILRLKTIFKASSLQMVSFTITEKGYAIKDAKGNYLSVVQSDIENGLNAPKHTMSLIAQLLYERFVDGAAPLTLVSMDNCSHNGDKLKASVIEVAKAWHAKGFVSSEFIAYLEDTSKITFPLSMIDKITPRPSETVKALFEKTGLEAMDVVITSKNTYMAPFVNAEISEYLVIEDTFTNGRPPLESAGIIFTDRETVNRIEVMKVTTCLNPLHTALAVTGCLLGYTLIADEMRDEELVKLIHKIGYDEGLKVVVNPEIIDPKKFIDEVVNERFKNPYIPDTPQRIATDTSQKVGIRFGETIKSYLADDTLEVTSLVGIPLAIAAWCRYLLGVDDQGKAFELSSDPLLAELTNTVKGAKIGMTSFDIKEVLSRQDIFGVDLYAIGLGEKIQMMFNEMLVDIGSVRKTLAKYL